MIRLIFLALLLLPSTALSVEKQRILAMAPHACEMLYAIGSGAKIVGAVSYCDYPEEAKNLPRLGSYERINVEAALRLQPDMAIVMSRSVIGVGQLEKLGVKIIVSNPDSFESLFSQIQILGKITGHYKQADVLVQQLRQRLDRVRLQSDSSIPVFYEIWSDPLLTAGGSGFITDVIRAAGGRSVFSGIDLETVRVNVESVVRAKPEVIVIPQEMRDVAARKKFWNRWLGKGNVRFIVVDPDLLHRPGPRLIDGVEKLQKALYEPDKEKL